MLGAKLLEKATYITAQLFWLISVYDQFLLEGVCTGMLRKVKESNQDHA